MIQESLLKLKATFAKQVEAYTKGTQVNIKATTANLQGLLRSPRSLEGRLKILPTSIILIVVLSVYTYIDFIKNTVKMNVYNTNAYLWA